MNISELVPDLAEVYPCVIAYIPGSGANKLVQTWHQDRALSPNTHGSPQTHQWAQQHSEPQDLGPNYDLYPNLHSVTAVPDHEDQSRVVSHCMSTEILRQQWPYRKIVKIFWDPILSLQRWWFVYGRFHDYDNPMVDSRWNPLLTEFAHAARALHIAHQILFHLEYYDRHWDASADYYVDISRGTSGFCGFLREDLDRCQDADFNTVANLMRAQPEIRALLSKFSVVINTG